MAIKANLNKGIFKKIIGALTSPLSILGDFTSEKYDVVDDVLPDVLAKNTAFLDSRVDNYIPGKGFVEDSKKDDKPKNNSRTRNSSSRNNKEQKHIPNKGTSKAKQIDEDLTR